MSPHGSELEGDRGRHVGLPHDIAGSGVDSVNVVLLGHDDNDGPAARSPLDIEWANDWSLYTATHLTPPVLWTPVTNLADWAAQSKNWALSKAALVEP
jgi:hypothetical protein